MRVKVRGSREGIMVGGLGVGVMGAVDFSGGGAGLRLIENVHD